MRVLAVWAVLFAAYAATLGVDAIGAADFAGDEPRHLLAAESIVSDRDVDLATSSPRAPPRTSTRARCGRRAASSSGASSSRRASASRC